MIWLCNATLQSAEHYSDRHRISMEGVEGEERYVMCNGVPLAKCYERPMLNDQLQLGSQSLSFARRHYNVVSFLDRVVINMS